MRRPARTSGCGVVVADHVATRGSLVPVEAGVADEPSERRRGRRMSTESRPCFKARLGADHNARTCSRDRCAEKADERTPPSRRTVDQEASQASAQRSSHGRQIA